MALIYLRPDGFGRLPPGPFGRPLIGNSYAVEFRAAVGYSRDAFAATRRAVFYYPRKRAVGHGARWREVRPAQSA